MRLFLRQARKSSPQALQEGDIVDGKYRVEKVLGSGGMGFVVAATHLELKRRVALKFMLPESLADHDSVKRFSREGRASGKLKGEHAVRVLDVGKLESGAPFIVMEFLVGEDLGALLEKGTQLTIEEAIDILLQTCEGISEAHALGIVHRDIKPRNIFLTQGPDGRALVKVLDFGLAKSTKPLSKDEVALTRTSAILGSPYYMSPEQMRGTRDADVRTDIWSLGVCLYEVLTGTMPFDGPTIPEVCSEVLKGLAEAPHERRPDLPPALSHIVLRCMEKDPEERFASLEELALALEPFGSAAASGTANRMQDVIAAARAAAVTDLAEGAENSLDVTQTAAVLASPPGRAKKIRAAAMVILALLVGVGVVVTVWHLPIAQSSQDPVRVRAPSPVIEVTNAVVPSEPPSSSMALDFPETPAPRLARRNARAHGAVARNGAPKVQASDPRPPPPEVAAPPIIAAPPPPPFDPAHAHVSLGNVSNEQGIRSRDVRTAIARALPAMNACYLTELRAAHVAKGGRATLHVETDGAGVIVHARATVAFASIGACVERTVSGLRMSGVDTGDAAADVALSFEPQ